MDVVTLGAAGDEDEFADGEVFGDFGSDHASEGHADEHVPWSDVVMAGEGLGVVFEGSVEGAWRDEAEAADREGEVVVAKQVLGTADAGEEVDVHSRRIRWRDYQ